AAPPPAADTPSAPGSGVAPAPASTRAGGEPPDGVVVIASPMVGTFYRASTPTAEPFVKVGAPVTAGQVVCIVEAMKLMNEIEAEVSGTIVEVLVENGQPVEFNQPLFHVRPD
ncbi:MAG: acetyl-CoA carboxylase biotin carboxyl carrier protein, partial [Candidatus Eisenbacteria bacterium]|nr:acetyl-CoA carboxylase biotin carboxyl carrier protein [Candidatus Eisenbacteria bacterium]